MRRENVGQTDEAEGERVTVKKGTKERKDKPVSEATV